MESVVLWASQIFFDFRLNWSIQSDDVVFFLVLDWSGVFIQFNRWNWSTYSAIGICQNGMAARADSDNNISIYQLCDSDVCHRNDGLCKCNLLLGPIRAAEAWTRAWRRKILWLIIYFRLHFHIWFNFPCFAALIFIWIS